MNYAKIIGAAPAKGRHASDLYPTPHEVTFALLDFLHISKKCVLWDPAAGEGDMVEAFTQKGYPCIGTDIQTGTDFLTAKIPQDADWIITNPPFSIADKFICRCAESGKPFALLLKSQYWHAKSRIGLFAEITPMFLLPLTWRPDFNWKSGKKGSPLMDVMWVVWGPYGNGLRFPTYLPLKRPKEDAT